MNTGPIYGVELIDTLPLGNGCMLQAMPSRDDLNRVKRVCQRTVAGYEVLLMHYRDKCDEAERFREALRKVIAGNWCVTELQEILDDIKLPDSAATD